MNTLSRDSILNAKDGKTEAVDVPEWGGRVFVRVLSGSQRDQLEAYITQKRDKGVDFAGVRALLVQLAACDEKGKPLFGVADLPAIGELSSLALQRVFDAASKLNGMTAGQVEGASADFPSAPS